MTEESASRDLDIAVIGMAGRFPGAASISRFWSNLRDGVESVTFFTRQEMRDFGVDPVELDRPEFVPAAPILADSDCFDAAFFGYSPREAELMDPQHRVFLECAWHALESAGYPPGQCPKLTGVYAGTSLSSYLLYNVLPSLGGPHADETFQAMIANDKDFLSTRVSYKLNLSGPSIDVQTGCSTSLVAIHLGVQALLSYQCDLALAGGVSIQVPQRRGYVYQKGGLLSPDGHCRAFDAAAEGTLFGSGAGIVVLKRHQDAISDGDHIHAIIRGSAINNDGSTKVGYTAPSIQGQSEVIRLAHAYAGVSADSIGYVECHGTGTPLGDPAEVAALVKAFRASTQDRGYCGVGSVKTNIGHLDAAAGVTSFIKTTLALEHGQIPPSLHFVTPHPDLGLEESPFYVNDSLSPWKVPSGPRRAGVSSFGIGGTNAHIVLEQPPERLSSQSTRSSHVLTLSARSNGSLAQLQKEIVPVLEENSLAFADICYTSLISRSQLPLRCAVVCTDAADATDSIRNRDKSRVFLGRASQDSRRVVFMFPGGGSQHVHMAADLYKEDPLFRRKLDEALGRSNLHLGFDLKGYVYPTGDATQGGEGMRDPLIGLCALFIVEYALAQYWIGWGINPDACIGHSLGEYVAACVGGILSFDDALSLVLTRSRLLMGLPAGAMLSIPLPVDEVSGRLGEDLSIAVINGPSQTVVSGPADAIRILAEQLLEEDIESRQIQIAVSSHSRMVEPILPEFRQFVATLKPQTPAIPCVSNVTGTWLTAEEATDPEYWVRHLRQTVLFGKGVSEFLSDPKTILLEVGPGNTLTTLLSTQFKSASAALAIASLRHPYDRVSDCTTILCAAAQLWVAGASPRWPQLYEGEPRHRVPLPGYPFERRRHWISPPQHSVAKEGYTKNLPYTRWFHRPLWSGGTILRNLPNRTEQTHRIVLCGDTSTLSLAVKESLISRGFQLFHLRYGKQFEQIEEHEYTVRRNFGADFRRFFNSWEAGDVTLIYFASLSPPEADSSATPLYPVGDLQDLLALVQAFVPTVHDSRAHLAMIVNRSQRLQDGEDVQPETSMFLGFARVAEQEFPGLQTQLVDLVIPDDARLEALTGGICSEILNPEPRPLLALRGHRTWTPSFGRLELSIPHPAQGLKEEGTYLITGGFGSLGIALAEFLAQTMHARLVLVGRSLLPDRNSWDRLLSSEPQESIRLQRIRAVRQIEDLGSEVLPLYADVCDPVQMEDAFAQAESRFGPIDGIFHLAGTTGQEAVQLIQDASPDTVAAQVRSKTLGAMSIDRVCRGRSPDFVFLFSSSAAYLGGTGLMAYAGANGFLDALATRNEAIVDTRWISANWDAWLSEDLREGQLLPKELREFAITVEQGCKAVADILSSGQRGQIIVSSADPEGRIERGKMQSFVSPSTSPPGEREDMRDLEAPYCPPSNEAEETVTRLWMEILGSTHIGIHDNFFDLGGTSLIALRLISRIKRDIGVEIPIVSIFERPTIATFAAFLSDPNNKGRTIGSLSETEDRHQPEGLVPAN